MENVHGLKLLKNNKLCCFLEKQGWGSVENEGFRSGTPVFLPPEKTVSKNTVSKMKLDQDGTLGMKIYKQIRQIELIIENRQCFGKKYKFTINVHQILFCDDFKTSKLPSLWNFNFVIIICFPFNQLIFLYLRHL